MAALKLSKGVIGFVLGVALTSVIYMVRGTGAVDPAVITPVLSGFFGGILGAIASFAGTYLTQRATEKRNDKDFQRILLRNRLERQEDAATTFRHLLHGTDVGEFDRTKVVEVTSAVRLAFDKFLSEEVSLVFNRRARELSAPALNNSAMDKAVDTSQRISALINTMDALIQETRNEMGEPPLSSRARYDAALERERKLWDQSGS